jgi:FlaA1/EpsC-like NDP-sugar epimerase
VDDDPGMWGSQVQRLEVIGSTRDLPRIAEECEAQEIVIAVPSAQPQRLRKIVERCEETGLPFKVLPGMAELLEGQATVTQLREVRIEDLLGRPPVTLELPELAEDLAGEPVLITGAAGSIGSELARQVALHHPGKLILLDQAETELYYLELELRERHPELELYPVIGDIVDAEAIESLFERFAPSRVYHAAAYKHVPMMEANAREAVRNNVVGTWRVADAAGRHGAARFVLVSTDKAVRPANVMGATKRVAEMIVTELQDEHDETTYSAVRFGNVLGSNGSVIPIFRRQLEAGKPLTVTHPDATRYFMTIPEAVQLILQASLLPAIRGQIAMLEMGEPVRIADLAKNLLKLSGADGVNGNGGGSFTRGCARARSSTRSWWRRTRGAAHPHSEGAPGRADGKRCAPGLSTPSERRGPRMGGVCTAELLSGMFPAMADAFEHSAWRAPVAAHAPGQVDGGRGA